LGNKQGNLPSPLGVAGQTLKGFLREGVKTMRQVVKRQWTPSLTERDIYRVLAFRYGVASAPRPRREVMEQLRQLLPYRRLSAHQLRRLMERAISDPRSETLLQVDITPPRDDPLGEAVRATLPSLQEVIIIPSLEHLDAQEVPTYLGIAAARAFEGRFVGGQGIGLGDGRAIHAFVTALRLPPLLLAHLQFFALTHCPTAAISGWGAENVLQLIADHWASRSGRQLQGYIVPTQLRAERLHWAFVEI
jgi:hypothetical protein